MKYLWLLLLLSVGAMAQTTTVNINPVTDGDGTVWAGGSYTIVLTSPPGVPLGPYFVNGSTSTVATQNVVGQLSQSGTASGIVLQSNNFIAPAGTVWQFTICPVATANCFITQISITGASKAVTITPPAIRINLSGIPYRVSAYNDTEIVNPTYGNVYYNVTEPSLRVCTGNASTTCTWQDVSAGGGLSCGTPGQPGIVLWTGAGCLIDINATSDGNGNLSLVSVTASGNLTAQGTVSGNRVATTGTGGILDLQFQTPPVSVPANHAFAFANSVTGLIDCLNNALTHCISSIQLLGSGAVALPTSAITSGACSAVVTLTATGATTSSHIVATAATDPTGVTGYAPSASGSVYVQAYVTLNTANFKVCNNTGSTITPGALTLNAVVF